MIRNDTHLSGDTHLRQLGSFTSNQTRPYTQCLPPNRNQLQPDCHTQVPIKEWCHDTIIIYSWVKGHAYRLNRPITRNARLDVEADTIADQIRMEARGPRGKDHNAITGNQKGFPYPLKRSSAPDT
jgi:hypothetical protein